MLYSCDPLRSGRVRAEAPDTAPPTRLSPHRSSRLWEVWYQALLPGGAIDAALRRLDGGAGGAGCAGGAADDINEERAFFSYEHFYVLYCSFCSLDEDGDPRSGRRVFLFSPYLPVSPRISCPRSGPRVFLFSHLAPARARTQPHSAALRHPPSHSRGALSTLSSAVSDLGAHAARHCDGTVLTSVRTRHGTVTALY